MINSKLLCDLYTIPTSLGTEWADPIKDACDKFNINSAIRIAAFLAQIGHESNRLKTTRENLNYSVDGLMTTFKKYFKDRDQAELYAREPEKIANRVYANRMGNGNEASGDGWKYSGRGLIQLTGKSNYQAAENDLKLPLVDFPVLVEGKDVAALTAAWFWNTNNLNAYADSNDFDTITRRINGGLNGKADRDALFAKAKRLL